ncbi:MAG TPA: hypothetical protein DCM40_10075 [Maribacter sp.]|nr:hypothetical protein [Maribacter sp.]
MLIREALIKEGFFDLKSSPLLRGLGVVGDDEEPSPPPPARGPVSDDRGLTADAWSNLEADITGITSRVGKRYLDDYNPEEETREDFIADMQLVHDAIKRHLDLDDDGFEGDKDDVLLSFQKVAEFDVEFVDTENLHTSPAARNFLDEFARVTEGGMVLSDNFDDHTFLSYCKGYLNFISMGADGSANSMMGFIKPVYDVFKRYLQNQAQINNSFLENTLNDIASVVVLKNFKNIAIKAIQEYPDTFAYIPAGQFEPDTGNLQFPFQIAISSGDDAVGATYFNANCVLDFGDTAEKLMARPGMLTGEKQDVNYTWRVKIEKSGEANPNVATLNVSEDFITDAELFYFVRRLGVLAQATVDLVESLTQDKSAIARDKVLDFNSDGLRKKRTWASLLDYSSRDTLPGLSANFLRVLRESIRTKLRKRLYRRF